MNRTSRGERLNYSRHVTRRNVTYVHTLTFFKLGSTGREEGEEDHQVKDFSGDTRALVHHHAHSEYR